MKFIHTGDIHYGMKPDSDKAWSRTRQLAIKNALHIIVSECKKKYVDYLFISGDLFHRQPILRDLKEINFLLSTIPDTRVCIIAGNHDHIKENSALEGFEWANNIYYITSPALTMLEFPDADIYGFSYTSKELKENVLAGIVPAHTDKTSILLAHGGDAMHLPFEKSALHQAGFSYYALGHIHKKALLYPNMAYCGSPEPLDINETGEHGVYYGEIDDATHVLQILEFIPIATASYIPLSIHVTPKSTNNELILRITQAIETRGIAHIYQLKIRGMRDPDIQFDLQALSQRLNIVRIIDESEPSYDFTKLFAEHPSDMIGFYIQKLNRTHSSTLEKKALYYGIDALLRTVDE